MADENSAEDQSSQPSGSGGGLVSLEQAVDIALGYAKDNVAFYEGRWSDVTLTWSVLSTEEREDAYYIRLSYQPAQRFTGEPGLEEFTISRTGGVLSRTILSDPQRKRVGIFGCSLVSAFGVFLAIAAMAVAISAV